LLGDRGESVAALESAAVDPQGDERAARAALCSVLKVNSPRAARSILATLARDPARIRALMCGIAAAGDPHYVPWLIAQMTDLRRARLSGEAFACITGLDLARLHPEQAPPAGPGEEAADDDIALDEDDGLPWPDPIRIGAWWEAHGGAYTPGTRYFMGAQADIGHCMEVLRSGFQRQRIAAAHYRSLLEPGAPLFDVRSPAWRQQHSMVRS
jgi:uncharacterized protein (TIGR02270 family)